MRASIASTKRRGLRLWYGTLVLAAGCADVAGTDGGANHDLAAADHAAPPDLPNNDSQSADLAGGDGGQAQDLATEDLAASDLAQGDLASPSDLLMAGDGGGGLPPISPQMFSLTVNKMASFPVLVPFHGYRGWDSPGGHWPALVAANCVPASGDPNDPCWKWTNLDEELKNLHDAGVDETMYTMSRSAAYAVDLNADPAGMMGQLCDYYGEGGKFTGTGGPGQCLAPTDLNPDGSGTNKFWKDWVTAIATHVNDKMYRKTHAHIALWEPWNEWYRNDVVSGYVGSQSSLLTWAQMLRIMEDTRCVIQGTGTIHNFPKAGQSTPCAQIMPKAIDAKAQIVAPSSGDKFKTIQNLYYCNANPKNDLDVNGKPTLGAGASSSCSWNGGDWGANAVDIVSLHMSEGGAIVPELVPSAWAAVEGALKPAEQAKPQMCGECSYSAPDKMSQIWNDDYSRAGFVPRFMAMEWTGGARFVEWYAYDISSALYDPTTGTLTKTGVAWTNTHDWLAGATPASDPFCSANGTVYTCAFTRESGAPAELVWDAQYGPGGTAQPSDCSTAANPVICGATSYKVPKKYGNDWVDVLGTKHAYETPVTIGANPILLE